MTTTKPKYEVASTVKAFEIIKIIADSDPYRGITLAELSWVISGSKSTIYRYLNTLEQLEFVEKDDRDSYFLGSGILQLAGHYLSNMNLPLFADPYMRRLAENSKETVYLAVPSENAVVYIAKVDGPLSIRLMAQIGSRMPMYCTALGKAILAHRSEEQVSAIASVGLERKTANTITDLEILVQELAHVRSQGYAVDNIENEEGVRCIGAPLFDYSRKLVGAVSLSGPSNRVTEGRVAELGQMVKETALAISRRMGYPH